MTPEFDNTAQLNTALRQGVHESLSIMSTGAGITVRGAAARGAMAARGAGTLLVSAFMTGMRLERMLQP